MALLRQDAATCYSAKLKPERLCETCGQPFFATARLSGAQRRAGHLQRFCSRKCSAIAGGRMRRKPVQPTDIISRPCEHCGKSFIAQHGALVCSPECRTARANERAKQRYQYELPPSMVGARECKGCGAVFTPMAGSGRVKFCSGECGRKYHRHGTGRNHRARARHYGVEYEPVDPNLVFIRDSWRCQICGRATPKSLRGTIKHNAPELDHRVPLVMGGPHTWANVQCACRECNGRKGGKHVSGQLPLWHSLAQGVPV